MATFLRQLLALLCLAAAAPLTTAPPSAEKLIAEAGIWGSRLVVERLVTDRLPYADSFVDLTVVVTARNRNAPESCSIAAHSKADGKILWNLNLPTEPTLGGLSIDRDGRALVPLRDGTLVCVGGCRRTMTCRNRRSVRETRNELCRTQTTCHGHGCRPPDRLLDGIVAAGGDAAGR
ncbi:MAG: hypothetical protein ABIP48_17625 [Planctomycetota bacterium]